MSLVIIELTVPGDPVAKPRQTRQDKWLKRPPVIRYRAWAAFARACWLKAVKEQKVRLRNVHSLELVFFMKPPKRKPKEVYMTRKPDIDNLAKSVMDALFEQDQCIHSLVAHKVWADQDGPRVKIRAFGESE